jgi:hypothetical protein
MQCSACNAIGFESKYLQTNEAPVTNLAEQNIYWKVSNYSGGEGIIRFYGTRAFSATHTNRFTVHCPEIGLVLPHTVPQYTFRYSSPPTLKISLSFSD